jgi:hypothetical protein
MAQGSQSLAVAHHCLEEIAYTKQTTLQFAVKYFTKHQNPKKEQEQEQEQEGFAQRR